MSQALSPLSTPPQGSSPDPRGPSLRPQAVGVAKEVGLGAALALGFAVGRERIFRRPTALAVLLGVSLVIAGAVIELRAGAAGAVDRALAGTFRLVIPLFSFGIVAEATGRGGLRDGVWPIARYGASRREVALGLIAAAMAASAILAALFAAGSSALAHGPGEPPLLRDAFQCAWIGALSASAYAAWFSLGAAFFKRGRGRWIPLLADFLLGSSAGFFGALLPRGNAQNLLGGAAPLHLSQPESSGILLFSAVILAIVAALRCGR